jgi:hypothetical protein
MPPPHNGISLCEKTYNLLEEWGIETKVFRITLDNASSNYVCVGLLRNQLNIKKALVCEGGFFHMAVNKMSLDSRNGLKQDVPTRWNSTYLMLETAIHYRSAFSYLEMIDSNYKHCPTAPEWEQATHICFFWLLFTMLHVSFLVPSIPQPTFTFL